MYIFTGGQGIRDFGSFAQLTKRKILPVLTSRLPLQGFLYRPRYVFT